MGESDKAAVRGAGGEAGKSPAVPEWYGWAALAAAFLLPAARFDWFPGLPAPALAMSAGEWLLAPLAVYALFAGLAPGIGKRGFLPLWLWAALPGVLWLLGQIPPLMENAGGESLGWAVPLGWIAALVLPACVFMPLLANAVWRDRLFWAIGAGVIASAAVAAAEVYGVFPASPAANGLPAGLLRDADAYGMVLVASLPLLASWQGGGAEKHRGLIMLFCMFLLPVLALTSCLSGGVLFAALAGLAVAWAGWRPHSWIMGVFVCLLLFGYGSGTKSAAEMKRRQAIALSAGVGGGEGGITRRFAAWDRALGIFRDRPYLGAGPNALGPEGAAGGGTPWYAALLANSGLIGLGIWVALLAELAGRALGRSEGPSLCANGVLGATAGLFLAGFWATPLVPGAGAFVGLLLAVSAARQSAAAKSKRRSVEA